MIKSIVVQSLSVLTVPLVLVGISFSKEPGVAFYPELQRYVQQRIAEFDEIAPERKEMLEELGRYVRECGERGQPAKLTFICTHNSRRSHLAQLWGAVAATHYGLTHVQTFSGGTESTAFNPRAVAAVKRAGLEVRPDEIDASAANPLYQVSWSREVAPLSCFSKLYNDVSNPAEAYCAVMTCSDADRNCPVVRGMARRLSIPYLDPKISDGSAAESQTYDERCAEIAREMLYAFGATGR